MGKPFNGMSLTGYDNMKQKYIAVWVDDMSTGMVMTEGSAENNGKAITFMGKMNCPATGEKDMPIRHVLRIVSPNKHVFEMYDASKGTEAKTMEITYTRK